MWDMSLSLPPPYIVGHDSFIHTHARVRWSDTTGQSKSYGALDVGHDSFIFKIYSALNVGHDSFICVSYCGTWLVHLHTRQSKSYGALNVGHDVSICVSYCGTWLVHTHTRQVDESDTKRRSKWYGALYLEHDSFMCVSYVGHDSFIRTRIRIKGTRLVHTHAR